MKELEVDHARKLVEELEAEGVIIIALEGQKYAGASWGKTEFQCSVVQGLLNALCKRMLELFEEGNEKLEELFKKNDN